MEVEERVGMWAEGVRNFIERAAWDAAVAFYRENEETLVDMNREQMLKGLMPDGTPITPEYTRWYAWIKRNKPRNMSFDRPDRPFLSPNLAQGAFHEGLHLETDDEKVEFTSSDPKWEQYVPPAGNFPYSLTPLRTYFGEVLGVPIDKEDMVDGMRNEAINVEFRKIFD